MALKSLANRLYSIYRCLDPVAEISIGRHVAPDACFYRRVDDAWGLIRRLATRRAAGEETSEMRRNEEIEAQTVRLVHLEGRHEILPLTQALEQARMAGLDLVEVAPDSQPPVVRILDFAEMQRAKRVKAKEQVKKIKEQQRHEKHREIRLTPRISPHDLQLKVKKITEFLEKRQKVTVVVMAPSAADRKMGHEALQYIQSLLTDKAKLCTESNLSRHGTVSMTLLPMQKES